MRSKRHYLLLAASAAAVATLWGASSSFGLVIGDFEGGSLDNWTPSDAFSLTPVNGPGVTSGASSLKVQVPSSFHQAILRSFAGTDAQSVSDRQALMAATQFSIDVTTQQSDFALNDPSQADSQSWIKFENLVINGPGINYVQLPINEANAWNEFGGGADPAGPQTRHFTVSLGSIPWGNLTVDPNTGAPSYLDMIIITQSSQNFQNLTYYFDNMQINQVGSVLAWNVDANGNWTNGANWSPNTPGGPNDSSTDANFFGAITQNRTITVNAARTVKSMNFSNANASYTIAGIQTITFAAASGAAGLNASAGTHTISAPVVLGSNLNISVDGGATINVAGSFNGGTFNVLKQGSGVVTFQHLRAGNLTDVSNGVILTEKPTYNDPNGTSKITALSISGNLPYVDITNNQLIVDYTGGSPIANIKDLILQGYNGGGGWVPLGLTSSTANNNFPSGPFAGKQAWIGFTEAGGVTSFGGQPTDSTSILIGLTIAGDTNLDGKVDVTDLGALATSWQQTTGVYWGNGDFNYDGIVDVTDLGALATNWQVGASGGASLAEALAAVGLGGVSVPEPAMLSGLGLCFAAAGASRRFGANARRGRRG